MKPIPISAAEKIAQQYGYSQVVIIARAVGDSGGEHCTTYGVDKANCAVAAHIGELPEIQGHGLGERERTMTPPVSGGVPEQGLREAASELLDCLRFVAPAKRDIENGNYAQLVAAIKRTRAALERPRPALPKEVKVSHKLLNLMDRECSPCAPDCPACASEHSAELCGGSIVRESQQRWADETIARVNADPEPVAPWAHEARRGAFIVRELLQGGAALPPQTGNPCVNCKCVPDGPTPPQPEPK